MKKAYGDPGYSPQKYDTLDGATEHFKKNDNGRQKQNSRLLYYLGNVVMAGHRGACHRNYACLLLAWLSRVDT